ncbi:UNVERIFIED_CONTAM: hypothetical protein HHA_461870 [Hammondia hammondi]|eukprot:XP_008883099.1 hypothetical protein HHA_461870 [Hammondia hammondi]
MKRRKRAANTPAQAPRADRGPVQRTQVQRSTNEKQMEWRDTRDAGGSVSVKDCEDTCNLAGVLQVALPSALAGVLRPTRVEPLTFSCAEEQCRVFADDFRKGNYFFFSEEKLRSPWRRDRPLKPACVPAVGSE